MAEQKTVQVEALKFHTNAGGEYNVGDLYDVPEDQLESLQVQGMAVPTDRVARARAAQRAGNETQTAVAKGGRRRGVKFVAAAPVGGARKGARKGGRKGAARKAAAKK